MTHKEITEKRNKLMTDASLLIKGDNVTSEQRAQFKTMMKDVDQLEESASQAKRVEDFEAEQRSSTRPPRSQPGEQHESADQDKNAKRAFSDWMRTGNVSAENRQYLRTVEQRDLGAGAIATPITGGNVLVPIGFDPQLNIALKSYGQLVGAVRQLNTDSGEGLRVSLANDTAQGLSVIGEAVAVSESDPALSGLTSYTDTLTTGIVKVSNQLLQDSAFNVDEFIQNAFGQRFYRGLAQMITQGNSSNIASIVAGSTLGATALTGDTTAIGYRDLVNTYASLDPAYIENASWVMSSTTRAGLMALTDNYGHPLLQTDLTTGNPFAALFGRPIVISQYSAAVAAGSTPILFGDLKAGYTLRQAGRPIIRRLEERFADTNEVGFVGFVRAGGYSTDAGTHPIVHLTMATS